MSRPRVCILTAGRGTRMGEGFAWINKALLPLEDKAVISHIIDACPAGTEFVIGLGHHAEQVRSYLTLAHPGTVFRFVEVDPWHGPGSGPGRSLWCCRDELREPFCFVPCDMLPEAPLDTKRPGSWAGVGTVDAGESARYCNLRVDDGRVVEIRDKREAAGDGWMAFTGFMRVDEPEVFWLGIEAATPVAGEIQVSAGLEALAAAGGLGAVEHPWTDVGEAPAYGAEILRRHGYDFSKPGEALYIVNGRVVKLFENAAQARLRVERGLSAPGVFPAMLDTPAGFLAYPFVEGDTFYRHADAASVASLLAWCQRELWAEPEGGSERLAGLCDAFYRGKTLDRVALLEAQGGLADEPMRVHGRETPGVRALLAEIDWDGLCAGGRGVRFHGDLQFDNVVLRPDGGFTLLDWRQDFAGSQACADIDYDLAKMLGGVRIDYSRVKRGELAYARAGDDASFDLPACRERRGVEESILRFASSIGRDLARIRLLVGLIHLNMAPLHAEPFSSALRDLARSELADELVAA